MVERAQEVTVVATSDKLGRRTFARICDLSSINRLVTDTDADPAMVAQLRDGGMEVRLA
jgi:DeoR family transcriptional regulator of aga operon